MTAQEQLQQLQQQLSDAEARLQTLYDANTPNGGDIAATSAFAEALKRKVGALRAEAEAEAKAKAEAEAKQAHERMVDAEQRYRKAWASGGVVASLEALLAKLEPLRDEVRRHAYVAHAHDSTIARGVLSDTAWLRQELRKLAHTGLG
jgi:cbb3-type cytochrome oxidase cytochrome c subunit